MYIEDVIKAVLEKIKDDFETNHGGVFEVTEHSSCCDGTRMFLLGMVKIGFDLTPLSHPILTFFLPSNFEDMERPPVGYVISMLYYEEQLAQYLVVAQDAYNVVWIAKEQ